tara:strand:+ start:3743 stop:4015 length:273 start_codon:yes stop_codon:yes gene_type:complete
MDKYVHKEGMGSLFKNTYKEKDSQPDLKGTMTGLDGKQYEVAGWYDKTKSGVDKISLKQSHPFKKDEGETTSLSKDEVESLKEGSDNFPF